jgi:hypothetical protein
LIVFADAIDEFPEITILFPDWIISFANPKIWFSSTDLNVKRGSKTFGVKIDANNATGSFCKIFCNQASFNPTPGKVFSQLSTIESKIPSSKSTCSLTLKSSFICVNC